MVDLTPPTERLVRSLLRANPPCVTAVGFARSLERRRGEPEDERERVVWHLRGSFELGELDPAVGLGELVVNLAERPPELARAILAGLRAAWSAPTPTQADALAVGEACVELAVARDAGLAPPAVGLLRFCVDPARPPVWHPAFADAVRRARESLTPELFAAIDTALEAAPALRACAAADLAAVRALRGTSP